MSRNRYAYVCSLEAQAVGREIAEPLRHAAEDERDEPGDDGQHLEDDVQHLGEDVRGDHEHDPERRDETALRLGRVELDVDRIRARPSGERRPRVPTRQRYA